jgi:hypothetical protein
MKAKRKKKRNAQKGRTKRKAKRMGRWDLGKDESKLGVQYRRGKLGEIRPTGDLSMAGIP